MPYLDVTRNNSVLKLHYIMSIQHFLTHLGTRQGSVFNVTVFNKMCDLRWLVCMSRSEMRQKVLNRYNVMKF